MKHPFNRAERRETKKHCARKDFFKTWNIKARSACYTHAGCWHDSIRRNCLMGNRRKWHKR